MKRSSLPHKGLQKFAWIALFGFVLFIFLWNAGGSSKIQTYTRDTLGSFGAVSGSLDSISRWIGTFFTSRNKLALRIEELETVNQELSIRSSLLEARIRELEQLSNFPEEKTVQGIRALIVSQAPAMPYGTLLVSFDEGANVRPGMKALGFGGVYLGDVSEAGENSAVIKLLSYPGLLSEAWLERLALNVTLEGQGGYNFKFSLPRSIKIEIGDKILSNTNPQFLVSVVEAVEEDPAMPLQQILLRLPLNIRNLRYVELIR